MLRVKEAFELERQRSWGARMNEPKPDYGAMNRRELRQDLEGYDFVTPTGVPLAPFLDSLMKENLDPRASRIPAKTSRP